MKSLVLLLSVFTISLASASEIVHVRYWKVAPNTVRLQNLHAEGKSVLVEKIHNGEKNNRQYLGVSCRNRGIINKTAYLDLDNVSKSFKGYLTLSVSSQKTRSLQYCKSLLRDILAQINSGNNILELKEDINGKLELSTRYL